MFCIGFVSVSLFERERWKRERGRERCKRERERERERERAFKKNQAYVLLLSITCTFSKMKRSDGCNANLCIVSSMQHTGSLKRNVMLKLRSFVKTPSNGTLLCAKEAEIKSGGV